MYRHPSTRMQRWQEIDRHASIAAQDVTHYPPPQHGNQILVQLSRKDRDVLLVPSEYIILPVGYSIARVADPLSTVYFPNSGVISVVSEMTTGHQLAVAAVGAEGFLGIGSLFGKERCPFSLIVLVESSGYRVPAAHLRHLFYRSRPAAQVLLDYVGNRMWEAFAGAACNRVHSHRQRLARWLLTVTDKAGRGSLPVTHETLAQMVGGPRHAVTIALNDLRTKGVIAHLRGRIEVLDRGTLTAHACECYAAPKRTGLYRQTPR